MKLYRGQNIFKNKHAFTIVELLVVIVIIGILAAVTIVSYSGVSNKAIAAGLQSDVSSNAKILKMYNVEYGYYPDTLDNTTHCPTAPTVDTRYCLKIMENTTISYTGGGQSFKVKETKGGMTYMITENSVATLVTPPIVNTNTVAAITSTTATLGATIESDGGDTITESGTCWGTTPNPTTNCTANNIGVLTPMSPATVTSGQYTAGLVISSDGTSAYSVNSGANNVQTYSRNPSTGVLTAGSTIATQSFPWAIVISSDDKNVYVINGSSGTISMYGRSLVNGALSALTPATIATGDGGPRGLAISPDGKSVYVANSGSAFLSIYSRDSSSGLLSTNGTAPIASNTQGVTVSPDGKSVYVAVSAASGTIAMYSRSLVNGSLNSLGTISAGNTPRRIAVSPDGLHVYATNISSNSVSQYSRDPSTGVLSALSPATIAVGTSPEGISLPPDGKNVYVANNNSATVSLLVRDSSSGLLTSMTPSTASIVSGQGVCAFDNNTLYVANYTQPSGSISQFNRTSSISTGVFTQARTGITSGRTIYYRGYAINSIGTGYSSDSTFVTP